MGSVNGRSVPVSEMVVDLGFVCNESRKDLGLSEVERVGNLKRYMNLKLCQLLTHLRDEF